MYGYKDIVCVDLETTGLSVESDEIIEIGAMRVSDDGTSEEFSTLVKCSREIPLYISQLTGIDGEMLKTAPDIDEALRKFIGFAGDSLLIAHNAEFDLGFLQENMRRTGLGLLSNPVLDTLALSRVLFPNLINHQLETIAAFFGWQLVDAHRALGDARADAYIAKGLWETMLAMPHKAFDRIEKLLNNAEIVQLADIFVHARMERMTKIFQPPKIEEKYLLRLENEFGDTPKETLEFSPDTVASYFLDNSPLADALKNFCPRMEQQQMAELVTKALANGELLMVEAGTGVGKSFAYLIPALFWAISSGEKIVVSTYTKALQEQLFFSDIAALAKVLPFEFKSVLLKGKGNYICLRRIERYIANPQMLSVREREGLVHIASWLNDTTSGDITENTAFNNMRQYYLWEKIRADGHTCIGRKCEYYRDCFVYKARNKVRKAQVVVVNHALLLSDLQGSILGDYSYLVVDEAHNLERVAVDHLGGIIAQWRFRSTLDSIFSDIPRPSGTLSFLMGKLKGAEEYIDSYKNVTSAVVAARAFGDNFFAQLASYMEEVYHWREQKYAVRKRYDMENPVFQSIESLGREFLKYISTAKDALKEFVEGIDSDDREIENLVEELNGETAKMAELEEDLLFAISPSEYDIVYWLSSPERQDSNDARLNWAQLNIGEILCHSLYDNLAAVILTSATLTVADDFSYYMENLGIGYAPQERIAYNMLGSPFDYESQLGVYVARFMPEPVSRMERIFVENLSNVVLESSRRLRKGTLVLFTSHSMLRGVLRLLHEPFKGENIRLLAQNISGSHTAIARMFTSDVESVLLGTESFWQGIDVPGDSLEVLFITRLPFGVPGEPYSEAKQERIRAAGDDPFEKYVIPQAVIRFRQGIGRLIRSETDTGVIVVMDPRITARRYGEKFVKSLPIHPTEVYEQFKLYNLMESHFKNRDFEEN